jgi:hypothetical protein
MNKAIMNKAIMTKATSNLTRKLVLLLSCACLPPAAGAAGLWAGADANTNGYGVRAGVALLPIPFVGSLGVEAGATRTYSGLQPNTGDVAVDGTRLSLAATLRDLNLPLTSIDAFGTLGAEFGGGTSAYAEAGLRGPLFGPAGWRAHVKGRLDGEFSAGVGIELRF